MKYLVRCIAVCLIVCAAQAVFAQNQSLPAWVDFNTDEANTTFGLYTTETGSELWTSIELDNGSPAIAFGQRVAYVATQNYFVEVMPGNYGKWYLVVYTTNESRSDVGDSFNPSNTSNLFLQDGSGQSCIWKYRKEVTFGREDNPVGSIIPDTVWEEEAYRYFVNVPGVAGAIEIPEEDLDYASLVNYTTTDWDYSKRIAIAFGIDMGSVFRNGQYTTDLVFEVYYKP